MTVPLPTMGRRARKRLQTRRAIADAALRLFLERGYDEVSVKEIADIVDVSVPTLFKYVPDGKEALMFDDGVERREGLLAAVRERPAGQSVMAALREFMSGRGPFATDPTPEFRRILELITNTPALRGHSRTLWLRCERDLAAAIAAEIGRASDDVAARAAARYVLEIPEFIGNKPDPGDLEAIFELLEHGLPRSPGQGEASRSP